MTKQLESWPVGSVCCSTVFQILNNKEKMIEDISKKL